MGAWGEGALESDQALDYLADIGEPVVFRVRKTLGLLHAEHEDIRAAAQVMIATTSLFFSWEDEDYDLAIERLTNLRNDQEFLADWRDPEAVAKALDSEIEMVKLVKANPATTTLMQRIAEHIDQGNTGLVNKNVPKVEGE